VNIGAQLEDSAADSLDLINYKTDPRVANFFVFILILSNEIDAAMLSDGDKRSIALDPPPSSTRPNAERRMQESLGNLAREWRGFTGSAMKLLR